ncbi:MAG: hypothetical protein ACE5JS_03280 [Nitrospinota bacterium]
MPRDRMLLGGNLSLAAAALLSGVLASQGGRVLFVDGANAFDPYIVARYVRRIGLHPRDILDREDFLLARAFTCHQLTILLEERVHERLEKDPAFLVVSGPLHTFMDESVPWREVRALFRRLHRALGKLSEGAPVLLAQPPVHGSRQRRILFRELTSLVETVALVEEDEWGPRVRVIKPVTKILRPRDGGNFGLLANREES